MEVLLVNVGGHAMHQKAFAKNSTHETVNVKVADQKWRSNLQNRC